MNAMANLLVIAMLVCILNTVHGFGKRPKQSEIKKEIYCVGCEYTVKALHKLIYEAPDEDELKSGNDGLDIKVAEAIQSVCTEENFDGGEIPAKHLVNACEYMLEENKLILEPLLVTHYTHATYSTYMDLSHQICMDISRACQEVPGEQRFPDHLDADLEYDKDTQTFRVKQGRNIRYPHPMRAEEDL